MDKAKLMIKAWEIAKSAVTEFGGKVREYLSESLKQAWSIVLSAIKIEVFQKLEEEIDQLLWDCDGGTTSYSSSEFEVYSPAMSFVDLHVHINGTVDVIKTRSIKGKEHRSYLDCDVDRDDGSVETLSEKYIAKTYKWTDAESIIKLVIKFSKTVTW